MSRVGPRAHELLAPELSRHQALVSAADDLAKQSFLDVVHLPAQRVLSSTTPCARRRKHVPDGRREGAHEILIHVRVPADVQHTLMLRAHRLSCVVVLLEVRDSVATT